MTEEKLPSATAIPTFESAQIEAGRKLFSRPVTFMLGVANLEQLPPENKIEICFAGRSNVGKSSLFNAVTGRKDMARTSNTPGRTQQLNYFDLDGALNIVDLPGYGFAQAPKDIVETWQGVIKQYLRGRVTLRRVFVLIDSRHGFMKADLEMMKMLDESAVSYQIVLTKADKLKKGQMEKRIREVVEGVKKHPAALTKLFATSSEKSTGLEALRAEIAMLL
ncbi:ribosome biogenesis GTP-binding protein YihA/YsxC [Thalassospira alkalitolerans]|uniref:Probable GTP-binding protein EngB n=1 Tax=Thalassospira alkalitolerans TaxID=1293890 RepID=A0A1Y2L7Q0_9PROT|nr:ribosome biogenesis GTP-binding protein YihA/YsxC [Thalassospira alkalitolerans]OSQ44275.1 GTP-binding protein [Thalassospira alkalitolerans]|tara:strand:+ start:8250 stop:8912 length:663 start_codon:yes stop_codon:yes gene_type:complete